MRELTLDEIDFFKGLLKYSKRINNGYYFFQPRNRKYGNKKYKEHRILMQLHLNMKLEMWEVVHHIDGDKLNNNIDNLEVQLAGNHSSNHHAGSKKFGRFAPSNKLSKNIIDEIKELSRIILKSDGTPNFSKIGRKLDISGFTVSKYLK